MREQVLCVGHASWDIILTVDGEIRENMKYRTSRALESGGGPAANAAVLLSRWGVSTAFTGTTGADIYGERIRSEFRQNGVDIRGLRIDPSAETHLSIILVNSRNGSRTIINRPLILSRTASASEASRKDLPGEGPTVLLHDGHELEASLAAIEQFPEAVSILDAGSYRESTKVLAEKVQYLVASEQYALAATGIDSMERLSDVSKCLSILSRDTSAAVTITLGERGSCYLEDGVFHSIPALPVVVQDTTGAGDIFHGAFAWAVLNGFSRRDIHILSSAAAGISVSRQGGRASIPSRRESLQAYRTLAEQLAVKQEKPEQ